MVVWCLCKKETDANQLPCRIMLAVLCSGAMTCPSDLVSVHGVWPVPDLGL